MGSRTKHCLNQQTIVMIVFTKEVNNWLIMVYKITNREQSPLLEDMRVFLMVIRKQSFAAAAEELGVSPAYISKRIQILESSVGCKLLHRTTRRVALTEDGEKAQFWAVRMLEDLEDFVDDLASSKVSPRGALHICSSFGFGRNFVAPAVAAIADEYPDLELRLDVFDRAIDLVGEGFDLEVRVGDDLPEQHICRKLVDNARILCCSPSYVEQHGVPKNIEDLTQHNCLVIKERNNFFGVWQLSSGANKHSVRVNGSLSTNNGEIALRWALDSKGIILRSTWDVQPLIDRGELVQVLPDYQEKADIWAVYPTRLSNSAKLRVCVEFLERIFNEWRL